jgi:anti-sigma regulatory factor (Ser/Thr protein kinase)
MPEIALPGLASMVPVARHAVRELLAGSPRADDAELIVSEYAGNAILHTRSALEGGRFRVVVDQKPGWARVEVHDDGPLPRRRATQQGEGGRGWELVDAFADRWGHQSTANGACTWAELEWTDTQ